jgi:energy-coupling factor transport system substrate-specific component
VFALTSTLLIGYHEHNILTCFVNNQGKALVRGQEGKYCRHAPGVLAIQFFWLVLIHFVQKGYLFMAIEEGASNEEQSSLIETPSTSFSWAIGVRQVVYIALGIALYAILSIIFNLVQLPNAAGGAISLRPGIVIPLFFGAFFGPVVGFLVGGVGNVLGDLISYHSFYWNWDLGNALVGGVAGLVVLITAARYRNTANIVIAEIGSVIAIAVGIGFAAYTDIWVSQNSLAAATSEFVTAGIPDAINGLILLPIVIVAYNAAVRGRGRY